MVERVQPAAVEPHHHLQEHPRLPRTAAPSRQAATYLALPVQPPRSKPLVEKFRLGHHM